MKTKNIDLMLSETLAHYNADQIIQGSYWRSVDQVGCFIGCLTHSDYAQGVTDKFGIETPLVKLLESIYEGLPEEESREFFKAIPTAIGKDGKDLGLVKWAFLRDMLKALPEQDERTQAVIDPVIEGMTLLADGKLWDTAHAAHAADAAYDAASDASRTSASASRSAAAAADAYDTAASDDYSDAAASDASASASASRSAAAASRSAYAYAERRRQAASILVLISAD